MLGKNKNENNKMVGRGKREQEEKGEIWDGDGNSFGANSQGTDTENLGEKTGAMTSC